MTILQFMKESTIGGDLEHGIGADGFLDELLSLDQLHRSYSIEFQVC